jgi:hypothetical protein
LEKESNDPTQVQCTRIGDRACDEDSRSLWARQFLPDSGLPIQHKSDAGTQIEQAVRPTNEPLADSALQVRYPKLETRLLARLGEDHEG